MAKMSNLTVGTRVECTAEGRLYGIKGIIQVNREGSYQTDSGYVWVVWNNLHNKKELVPQWEFHKFLKIIG